MAELIVSAIKPPPEAREDLVQDVIIDLMHKQAAGRLRPQGLDAFNYVYQVSMRLARKRMKDAAVYRGRHCTLAGNETSRPRLSREPGTSLATRASRRKAIAGRIRAKAPAGVFVLANQMLRKARAAAAEAGDEDSGYARGIVDALTRYRTRLGERYCQ